MNPRTLPLGPVMLDVLGHQLTDADRAAVLQMVADPGGTFVAHTKDFENFAGTNAHLLKVAADAGYRQEMLAVIPDSYGRPTFEVYRFATPEARQ